MSISAPIGFRVGSARAGLKATGDDIALLSAVSAQGRPIAVSAAGVFTSNLAAAAPVLVSKEHLEVTGGHCTGVVINAGNANAANGADGMAAATAMAEAAAKAVGVGKEAFLVCSTGLIGIPFPTKAVVNAIPEAARRLGSSEEASLAAARAIMTTDTKPKQFFYQGDGFCVGGMAKGAAMLAPDLATMLAFITTDAECEPESLKVLLKEATEASFNRIVVDGCTSTNDTVLAFASGARGSVPLHELASAINEACASLANQMIHDAEGATRVMSVTVKGALDDKEALIGARKVAGSMLVKASLNGADPYWGRVVSDLGSAGIAFQLDKTSVSYGGVVVAQRGVGVTHDKEAVARHCAGTRVELVCDLGVGPGQATVLGCDLSEGYIEENRKTS
jgi:glutamate N-acetyltransferase/amino-acid N-acetyltransferase